VKLVFYSGGDGEQNHTLDKELLRLCQNKSPRITFIPSCSFDGESDFQEFVDQYSSHKIYEFLYFPIDVPSDRVLQEEAFKSDVIHLGGGNTFYFLKHLRSSRILPRLKEFVKRGGILTGLSAGAILMTPSVATASIPDFDCDENHENITNLKAMGLVKFEFFPHYKNSKRYDIELKSYSKNIKHPLYACPDGAGIIVAKGVVKFVGKSFGFYQGQKFKLSFV